MVVAVERAVELGHHWDQHEVYSLLCLEVPRPLTEDLECMGISKDSRRHDGGACALRWYT